MSSSSIIERLRGLLAETPPFDRLPGEERQALLADLVIEYFKPGEVILQQGATQHPGLYVVESGLVRLMDVGAHQLVDKCGAGECFGSFGLLKGGALIYEARALEETVCARIPPARFLKLYEAHEDVALYFDRDIRSYMRHRHEERDVAGEHVLLERPLRAHVHRAPVTCPAEATARQAAQAMRREGVGSLLVMRGGRMAGLPTRGDLADRLVARGRPPETPAHRLMSRPVHTIGAGATLFDAITAMLEHGVRRLLVMADDEDAGLRPLGLLTDRDVAHVRGVDPVATMRRIRRAQTLDQLAGVRAATSDLLLRLYRQGVSPERLQHLLAHVHDRLVVRVLELTLRAMKAARVAEHTAEAPALAWAWVQLGSGGRRESMLTSRQHNALVYADPPSDAEAARAEAWFGALAERVGAGLEAVGLPTSDVAAQNAAWRRPLRAWKRAYRYWIHEADEDALAHVPFFFDLRCIYGTGALVDALKADLVDALNVQALSEDRQLLARMAENARARRPPASFFGRFVLEHSGAERGALDLRARGTVALVAAARVLALDLRYVDSAGTFDRLRHAARALPEMEDVLTAALDAYHYVVDFRLEDQLRAVEAGEAPDNRIDPAALSRVQQNLLRSAFRAVGDLQDALAERYGLRRGWTFPGRR